MPIPGVTHTTIALNYISYAGSNMQLPQSLKQSRVPVEF